VAAAVTGLDSFLASFTGPEVPIRRVSNVKPNSSYECKTR
jgi:hypothetical protein